MKIKNDINYEKSYTFKIKVGDYYHTVKKGKEDYAMIVYTGEKSQNNIYLYSLIIHIHPIFLKLIIYILLYIIKILMENLLI